MIERESKYKNKRRIYSLIFVIIVLLLSILILRIVLGGDEDTWICKNGTWIQHGNPSDPMPTTQCE